MEIWCGEKKRGTHESNAQPSIGFPAPPLFYKHQSHQYISLWRFLFHLFEQSIKMYWPTHYCNTRYYKVQSCKWMGVWKLSIAHPRISSAMFANVRCHVSHGRRICLSIRAEKGVIAVIGASLWAMVPQHTISYLCTTIKVIITTCD